MEAEPERTDENRSGPGIEALAHFVWNRGWWGMKAFHLLPGSRVVRLPQVDPTTLPLEAPGVRAGARCRCPGCAVWSEAGHGSCHRQPADLPRLGKGVPIVRRGRRFCCHNVACARRTFAERLPGRLAVDARRTSPGWRREPGCLPRPTLPASTGTLWRLPLPPFPLPPRWAWLPGVSGHLRRARAARQQEGTRPGKA